MAALFGNVLITGANRGIGFEIVRQLAANEKNRIFAGCRDPNSAKDLKALSEQNKNVSLVKLDVMKDSDIEEAAKSIASTAGFLNVLINNAGIYECRNFTLSQMTRELLNRHFDVNVTSQTLMAQQFRELLAKGAANHETKKPSIIINIGSMMGSIINTSTGAYPYRASKTALNMITKCLANELAPEGIHCLSIHPGWVQTDMGGGGAAVRVPDSAAGIIKVTSEMTAEQNGKFYNYLGQPIQY